MEDKTEKHKKKHNPNHHGMKCFFDFSWHVALVFALRSMLIHFFPHPIPDTKINTSETSCAGSHENSLIKFRQKLTPNFSWWIVFFDPHRVKKQIKSPWHGGPTWKTSKIQNWNHHGTEGFFDFSWNSSLAIPTQWWRVVFRPPGHFVKILASGRKGKNDTDGPLWTPPPPPGTRVKHPSGDFVWEWSQFSEPLQNSPPSFHKWNSETQYHKWYWGGI